MPNVLRVTGIFCGIVEEVSSLLPGKPIEFWRTIKDFEERHCLIENHSANKSLDTLMIVLCRGRLKDRWPDFHDEYPDLELLRSWYNGSQFDQLLDRLKPHEPVGKTLLATDKGYLGMGNTSAKSGMYTLDIVTVSSLSSRNNLSKPSGILPRWICQAGIASL